VTKCSITGQLHCEHPDLIISSLADPDTHTHNRNKQPRSTEWAITRMHK